jgi:hypothetical protein
MISARKILKEFFLGLFLSGLVSVDIFNIALLKSFAGYISGLLFSFLLLIAAVFSSASVVGLMICSAECPCG